MLYFPFFSVYTLSFEKKKQPTFQRIRQGFKSTPGKLPPKNLIPNIFFLLAENEENNK